ncbi:MAG: GAF domain-containing protein [Chroococcidiopsidaceae cyanobacterium CP_BM_RX_35]|nr:GAF domain-containing protein [Chroococcidiopsidaceae cyanobacterium CP_BM_RX_35]
MKEQVPAVLEKILASDSEPNAVFVALLPALGGVLYCDRCFLYLRSPYTHTGKLAYCWRRAPQYPDMAVTEWTKEPESLPLKDPLFAAALRAEESIFVEDVETASPEVVNLAFEQKNFGHRALIHAHLCLDGLLWGILQPCVFDHPRVWTAADRSIVTLVTEKITPLAVAYVKAANI